MDITKLLQLADTALDETVALLSDLVRAESINAGTAGPGNESDVCRVIAAKLAESGIQAQILESAPNRGNLVCHIGPEDSPSLMFMSHSDVVPVDDASLWQYPPFAGIVADGYVHGRGAADCKALAAASTMATLVIARAGISLHGKLTLAVGADEECGGNLGFGWLAQHHPQAIRADYAINEGGGSAFNINNRYGYLISIGEKGRLEANINVNGKGGHAAVPWASNNPIENLAEVVFKLQQYQPAPDLSHPLFTICRDLLETEVGHLLQAPFASIAAEERSLATALRGASRMTITPTMVSAGSKSNAIPSASRLTCDVRTLPGQTQEDVERELLLALADMQDLSITVTNTATPSASPYPTPFSAAIEKATALAVAGNDLAWLPGITVGFTDSRHIRPLGTIVYGFAPQSLDTEKGSAQGVHGRDERIPIDSLRIMLRMLVALAADMLSD